MKYKFHVGDYVEMKDGRYGYITEIYRSIFQFHLIGLDPKLVVMQYPLYDSYSLYGNNFNRIGQYDFTKPENPKEIERLKEFERENIWNERSGGWLYAQHRKINELVDAVNELRKERT